MQHLIRALALSACFGAAAAEPPAAAPASTPAPAPASAPAAAAVVVPPDIPGDSFVVMADALRGEALAALGAYAKEKYACDAPRVLDSRTKKASGKVKKDRAGWLRSGTITESWKVDVCGTTRTLTVVLNSSPEGKNSVAISEPS